MNKSPNILKVLYLAIPLAILAFFGLLFMVERIFQLDGRLRARNSSLNAVTSCLFIYTKENDGMFPENLDDLIEGKYIKPQKDPEYYRIIIFNDLGLLISYPRSSEKDYASDWDLESEDYCYYPVYNFNQFKINYACDLTNLEINNGVLVDKTSGTEVFLLSSIPEEEFPTGSNYFVYSDEVFRKISLSLYKYMTSAKGKEYRSPNLKERIESGESFD